MNSKNQEDAYEGLLGLDSLPPVFKFWNFLVTLIIGTVSAYLSWAEPLYNEVIYSLSPFAWPLIFLFAWPVCGVILWLRLTGITWSWSLVGGVLIFVLYTFAQLSVYIILPT